jgi:hypothetical protein
MSSYTLRGKRLTWRLVGRPDLVTQEQHRHKQLGRAVKDQSGKKVEWTKLNAVKTKRKQDYLDQEAKKAAKSVEFLNLPSDDDNFPAQVCSILFLMYPDLYFPRAIISGPTVALIQTAFSVRTYSCWMTSAQVMRCTSILWKPLAV